jgi:hypothetical protein
MPSKQQINSRRAYASLSQITLRNDWIQAEFHPLDHSILVLFEAGEVKRFSVSGREIWRFSLSWKPLVFRLHLDGNLVAILGEGVLAFLDLHTSQMTTVPVDTKYRLLEFYKSCALIGGRTNSVTLIKPNGQELTSLSFEFFIYKIKTVPLHDNFFLYNEDKQLLCLNIEGKRYWTLENYSISGDIHVSKDGDLCLFMHKPYALIKFSVSGNHSFAIDHPTPVKNIALSLNGMHFMILDVENRLMICNQDAHILWQHPFDHAIRQIRLSRDGTYFITIDGDQLLTCYAVDQAYKSTEGFLEFDAQTRAADKRCLWCVKPGSHLPHQPLRLLTVNGAGKSIGIVGQDGRVYFLDDTGQTRMAVAFPPPVEAIGISDAFDAGYIYGEHRLQLINFRSQQIQYILFPPSPVGKPLVNFFHQKLCCLSSDQELWMYDFEGHVDRRLTLSRTYHKILSCEAAGIALLHDQGVVGMFAQGHTVFTLLIEEGPAEFYYIGHWIIGTTRQSAVIAVDLASLQVKKRKLAARQRPVRIVSLDPLLITLDERLVHLHYDLSVISTHAIRSHRSVFSLHEGHLYEILSTSTGLVCYDEQGNLAWRYRSEDHLRDYKLTRNGIVLMTEGGLYYIALRKSERSQKQLAQFLEI